jgi:hypothetical protein
MEEVEEADREQLDLWYQVLPSLPYGDTPEQREIQHRLAERFQKMGGMTPELSRKIGFGWSNCFRGQLRKSGLGVIDDGS